MLFQKCVIALLNVVVVKVKFSNPYQMRNIFNIFINKLYPVTEAVTFSLLSYHALPVDT